MGPQPLKRAAHRPSRRDKIVDAAIHVFGRKGLTETTVADIAAGCGMVPAAVYYHFDAKEPVLVEAVRLIGHRISEVTTAAVAESSGLERRDALRHIVERVFDWVTKHPEDAQLFFIWSVGASPEIEEARAEFMRRHIAGIQRYLPPARARTPAGRRREQAARDLAARTAIMTAINTSVAWLSEDVFPERARREEVIGGLVRVMERTLATTGPNGGRSRAAREARGGTGRR